jgi:levansucrase
VQSIYAIDYCLSDKRRLSKPFRRRPFKMDMTAMPPRLDRDTAVSSLWTWEHLAKTATQAPAAQAIFKPHQVLPIMEDLFLWDLWPFQTDDGAVAEFEDFSLWIVLSAPRTPNELERHDVARLRLLTLKDDIWIDCGLVLPEEFSPGTRQWSGSTRIDVATGKVTLWFTAAGSKSEPGRHFEQQLYNIVGWLNTSGPLPKIERWENLTQCAVNTGELYLDLKQNQGVAGRIKGFRDPYWFRDPNDGKGYLLFTGSKSAGTSKSDFDGVIGLAEANDHEGLSPFTLRPAILDADGVASELELPHMLFRDGLYYLFWSTQSVMFAPEGPIIPTGLFGMVGRSVHGPFEPLNGSGLVLANPIEEPRQAYAWQVLPSLKVISFVDYWGQSQHPETSKEAIPFCGTLAPMVEIVLDGNTARLA